MTEQTKTELTTEELRARCHRAVEGMPECPTHGGTRYCPGCVGSAVENARRAGERRHAKLVAAARALADIQQPHSCGKCCACTLRAALAELDGAS